MRDPTNRSYLRAIVVIVGLLGGLAVGACRGGADRAPSISASSLAAATMAPTPTKALPASLNDAGVPTVDARRPIDAGRAPLIDAAHPNLRDAHR